MSSSNARKFSQEHRVDLPKHTTSDTNGDLSCPQLLLRDEVLLMIVGTCLLAMLFTGSTVVWWQFVTQWQQKRPLLEIKEEPRANWASMPELAVAYVALLWTVANQLAKLSDDGSSKSLPLDLSTLALETGIFLGLVALLPLILISRERPLSHFGISFSKIRRQWLLGIKGFFAAILPMAISMLLTLPFRGRESQHSMLKLLEQTPGFTTIALVAVTAVVAAPLAEELLYRVILQGWLTTLFPATFAIGLVAVLFAMVHGWRDGLALLPLALILGYVFHRQHSYLSVVVIHALFNATMLALQLLRPPTPT